MRVYISGRITGLDMEDVKNNFRRGAEEVVGMGFEPVSPLENGLPQAASWREHMLKDISILMGCEAIYMLSNWRNSVGARIEKHIADEMRLKCFYQPAATIGVGYIDLIKQALKEATGLGFEEYISKSRRREFLFPRMVFVEQMRRVSGANDLNIAKMINRDHSTLSHYRKLYPDELKFNSEFRRIATAVENFINENVLV